MGVARRTEQPVTVEAFLAFVDARPEHEDWELIDGRLVLMVRPTPAHAQIVANLIVALRPTLDGRGCRALADVLVRNPDRDDFALTPDLLVRCGPAGAERFVTDPVAIVEVLSPSTMDFDRGQKVVLYKSVRTVETIVLVYQAERRVEVIRRMPDEAAGEGWAMDVLTGDGQLDLPGLGVQVPLGALYAGAEPEPA